LPRPASTRQTTTTTHETLLLPNVDFRIHTSILELQEDQIRFQLESSPKSSKNYDKYNPSHTCLNASISLNICTPISSTAHIISRYPIPNPRSQKHKMHLTTHRKSGLDPFWPLPPLENAPSLTHHVIEAKKPRRYAPMYAHDPFPFDPKTPVGVLMSRRRFPLS